ncbi:MAG: hypothetical protein E6G97_02025 [Alphaproteobacteria bacterium]|nr:MAG: hypothetical protein E6G97_02025 [Alphaproteobacteria bacterium]
MADPARTFSPSLLILDPELLARVDAHCTAEGEDPAEFVADAVKLALDEAGSRVELREIEAMLADEEPRPVTGTIQ